MNDVARCETLAALSVMESHKDDDFARINRLAAALFGAPASAIAVVDATRAWLVSAVGTDLREIPVAHSFAARCIAADGPVLVVPDATADSRFSQSMLVTGQPGIRFYAGAPIEVHGQRIGALQIFAPEAREDVPPETIAQFKDLAGTCGALFELKDEARVRARTAAELIKEEWRHALTLEAGKVGSWVWDIPGKSVIANDILRRMFDLGPSGPVAIDDIFNAMHPADRPVVELALAETFEHGIDYTSEFRITATGRWLVGRGRVYQRDAKGKPLVMMGVNIDVTEQREAADHTRHLLRELNHRVKNTLAMIQSLARQSMTENPDPAVIASFSGRLRMLSDAHALLADRDWSGIGITELIDSEVAAFLVAPGQLTVSGEEVQLPPDHALGLGIVLHELASNAARHGALSTGVGQLAVSWGVADGWLNLSWIENGGPPVPTEVKRRFGARLIERGLDKVLGSRVELDFAPAGVRATVSLPLG